MGTEFQDVASIRTEKHDLKWLITLQVQAILETARKPEFQATARSDKFLIMRSNLQMLEGLLWSKIKADSSYFRERDKILKEINQTPPDKPPLLEWFKILCTRLHYFGLVEAVSFVDYMQSNDARAMNLVNRVMKLAKDSPPHYNIFAEELERQIKENKDLIEEGLKDELIEEQSSKT